MRHLINNSARLKIFLCFKQILHQKHFASSKKVAQVKLQKNIENKCHFERRIVFLQIF